MATLTPPQLLKTVVYSVSLLLVGMAGSYAETTQTTAPAEYVLEVNGQRNQQLSLKAKQENWNKQRLAKLAKDAEDSKKTYVRPEDLPKKLSIKLNFPAPPKTAGRPKQVSSLFSSATLAAVIEPVVNWLLPAASAATANQYGAVAIDGDLGDWTIFERINLPLDKPPYMPAGSELYARYVAGENPVYIFAIKADATTLGANTTLYLNTDQNANTGFKLWGLYGGAEYNVNIFSDGSVNLYDAAFNFQRTLEYAYNANKTSLEIVIPAAALAPLVPPQSIQVLADINDTQYLFPADYVSGGQFVVAAQPEVLPVRTDMSKRVGIVFSEASKNNFFDDKAYSQLYMALQHQAMMAGIGFDLLTENDLTRLDKLVNYDALIFPYASNVTQAQLAQIRKTLFTAVYRMGVGIITADNWLTNDENNAALPGDSYQIMKQLIGITRENGAGPVAVDLLANDVSHPAMKGYSVNEPILSSANLNSYKNTWTSFFTAIPDQAGSILAKQNISGVGLKPGVIATTTGGRNVHFGSAGLMADGPLVWQALQWVVYGSQTPVGLKMGRNSNLFISRNDMDQSQEYGNGFYDDMGNVDVPLYDFLSQWKNTYNFVGSFYINIGNNPPDQQTVWNSTPPTVYDSAPLYKKYIALGNEIGTHSYTHPADTNLLTPTQLEFEFNQSMDQIAANLNPTWKQQNIRGGAVPGMPEGLKAANNILQYLDYLSGGAATIGAGYPSAIGYLTPSQSKVYFSPNMTFDFTLIEYGVPTGNPPVPVKMDAAQAEKFWAAEYDRLMNHAAQPIIHWPWHDYGPTSGTTPQSGLGYSLAMFQNTIAKAFASGAEFTTVADAAQRISTFKQAKLSVTESANQVTATVNGNHVGQFALAFNLPAGQKIQKVSNWYAYNDDKVFLADAGGAYSVFKGVTPDNVTHVIDLPMRATLLSVNGDGNNLNVSFEGEGRIKIALSDNPSLFQINSDGGAVSVNFVTRTATVNFANAGIHTLSVKQSAPVATAYLGFSYTGRSQTFTEGVYRASEGMLSVIGDNKTSSISLSPGYRVKACQNSDGSGVCNTWSSSVANVGNALVKQISYLEVSKI